MSLSLQTKVFSFLGQRVEALHFRNRECSYNERKDLKMPNLAELMKGRVEDLLKGPKPVPIADYPAVIRKFEVKSWEGRDKKSGEQKTYSQIRLWVGFTDWAKGLEENQKEGIQILQRQTYCDYWLPVGRDFALLCQQCGLSGEISELTPQQLIGSPVLACVKHEPDRKDPNQLWAVADKLIGTQ